MGVLIISPFDKGGKLYEPSPELVQACDPLHPLQYGALWIWSHPSIHTITVGAERPTDFECHMTSAAMQGTPEGAALLEGAKARLLELEEAAGFDRQWRETWWHHLPNCFEIEAKCPKLKLNLTQLTLTLCSQTGWCEPSAYRVAMGALQGKGGLLTYTSQP